MFIKKTRHIIVFLLLIMFTFGAQDLVALGDTGDENFSPVMDEIVENLENEEIPEIEEDKKIAYLTIDDGPTIYTEKILDILCEYQVPATFFMLEPQMERNAQALKRMRDEGHGLGLHGVTHDRKKFYQSAESVVSEMDTAQARIEKITDLKTFLIRTPYGSKPFMKPGYMEAAEEAGYKIWDWNVDSRDWFFKDERMVDNTIEQLKVLESRKIEPVILFHDLKNTVRYLPQMLEYLINNGYTLKVLDTYLEPVQLK